MAPHRNRIAMAIAALVGIAVFFTTGARSRLLLAAITATGLAVGLIQELRARNARR